MKNVLNYVSADLLTILAGEREGRALTAQKALVTADGLVPYDEGLRGACMFCQLCVNACPHDAIRFDTEFENAVFDRSKLVLTLNKK